MSYGVKVSKYGQDVGVAADADLLFNTNEEMLKVYKSGSFDVTSHAVNDVAAATHNFGYVPMYLVFVEDSDGDLAFVALNPLRMGQNDLVVTGDGVGGQNYKGYYIIYYNSLEEDYTSDIINKTSVVNTYIQDSKHGINVSENGDVKSGKTDDLVFSSNFMYNKIHKIESTVKAGAAGSEKLSFSHLVGEIPLAIMYGKIDSFGDDRYQIIADASDSQLNITSTAMELTIGYDGTYTAVIFKDIYE